MHEFSDVIQHFVDTADYLSPELPDSIREQFEFAKNQLDMANTPAEYHDTPANKHNSASDDSEEEEEDIPISDSEEEEEVAPTGRYVKTTAKLDLVKFQHDASGIDHKNVVEVDSHSIPAGGLKNMVKGHPSQGIYNLTIVSAAEEGEKEEEEEEGKGEEGE